MGQQYIPKDLSKIIKFRFSAGDRQRLKPEDVKLDQPVEFRNIIEVESKETFSITGIWTWIETYPKSFVANFETNLNGHAYLGEVYINYGHPDNDVVLLKRDCLLRTFPRKGPTLPHN